MAVRRDTMVGVAVLALVAGAYVASVPGVLFVKPDSAVYMSAARSIARGEGYTYNCEPLGKYPPIFPLMLSTVYRKSGENIWRMQCMVARCGVGAIVFAWLLVRARSGVRMAMAVLVLTATCTWYQAHSCAYILAGTPYALFSLAALWLAERAVRVARLGVWLWVLAAAVSIVAAYTHVSGVALIPALVGAALFARGNRRPLRQRLVVAGAVGAACTAAALVWFLSNRDADGAAGYRYHLDTVVPTGLDGVLAMARLRLSDGAATVLSRSHNQVPWGVALGLGLVFLLPGLVKGFRERRSAAEIYLCTYLVLLLFAGGQGGHERYMVPVIPLLFYYAGLSTVIVCRWAARLARAGDPARAGAIAATVLILGVAGNAVVDRVRGKRGASVFRIDERREAQGECSAWKAVGRWIAEAVPEDGAVYVGAGGTESIVHYFSGRRVVSGAGVPPTVAAVAGHICESGADWLFADYRDWSTKRIGPVLERFPECFTLRAEGPLGAFYHIERERLRAAADADERRRPGEGDD